MHILLTGVCLTRRADLFVLVQARIQLRLQFEIHLVSSVIKVSIFNRISLLRSLNGTTLANLFWYILKQLVYSSHSYTPFQAVAYICDLYALLNQFKSKRSLSKSSIWSAFAFVSSFKSDMNQMIVAKCRSSQRLYIKYFIYSRAHG